MLQFRVYDVNNELFQTIVPVNAEFYLGLLLGALIGIAFWLVAKGAA